MDDPLDYVDFGDVVRHGNPNKWKFKGSKPGSGVAAHSPDAAIGTTKHYDRYEDEFGRPIEVHYFRLSDGSVEDVKVIGL